MAGTRARFMGVCFGFLLGLAGCATREGGGSAGEGPPASVLVGRIASVPAGRTFVLIQSYGGWPVPAGEPVFSTGPEGRTANLLPTGERMGQFLAADLRSGDAAAGDAVFFRPPPDTRGRAVPE